MIFEGSNLELSLVVIIGHIKMKSSGTTLSVSFLKNHTPTDVFEIDNFTESNHFFL